MLLRFSGAGPYPGGGGGGEGDGDPPPPPTPTTSNYRVPPAHRFHKYTNLDFYILECKNWHHIQSNL